MDDGRLAPRTARQYHSTALLLPDGRVLMAGGGALRPRARPEERRDLLAAVPLQGRAADDHDRAGDDELRRDASTSHAGRRADREGLADPLAVRDARVRQEPALPVPELHAGSGKVTVPAPANANLAPPGDYMLFIVDGNGVPSIGSFIRIPSTRRHDAADGADEPHRPARRRGRSRSAGTRRPTTSGDRELQRLPLDDAGLHADRGEPDRDSRSTTRDTRRRPNGAGHVLLPGHGATTPPATRAPPRTRCTVVVPHGAAAGTRRRLRLRRRQRHDGRGRVRQRQQRHDRRTRPGSTSGQVRQRALLQRHQRLGHRPRLELARPDDRHDARGVGQPDDARQRVADRRSSRSSPATTPTRSTRTTGAASARADGEVDVGGATRRRGTSGAPAEHVDASRDDLRRHVAAALRQRRRWRRSPAAGSIVDLDRPAQDRRQRDLGRVVQRPDRRGAGLQPGADRGRDPAAT